MKTLARWAAIETAFAADSLATARSRARRRTRALEILQQDPPLFPKLTSPPTIGPMMSAKQSLKVRISRHAAQRLAQRGISLGDVHLVLRLGRRLHRTGVIFYFFGRRQIPRGLERELERLEGTTLIVADGRLITAYRNKRAIAEIKKKPKRRAKRPFIFEVPLVLEDTFEKRCA
ncbi:MAG: DUF4258 domain-containing protein [Blastocatellia bacterium]|nr:DUF4258 domain-containing protein [Blastocatellia bacterium]